MPKEKLLVNDSIRVRLKLPNGKVKFIDWRNMPSSFLLELACKRYKGSLYTMRSQGNSKWL